MPVVRTGQRRSPITPVPGITFHDLRVGDRVVVNLSGRTGQIIRRCKVERDGWVVRWDEPKFGVTEGRVAWPNLSPAPMFVVEYGNLQPRDTVGYAEFPTREEAQAHADAWSAEPYTFSNVYDPETWAVLNTPIHLRSADQKGS